LKQLVVQIIMDCCLVYFSPVFVDDSGPVVVDPFAILECQLPIWVYHKYPYP